MQDLISRQDTLDAIRKCSVKEVTPAYTLIDKAEAVTELMMLPPAKPKTTLVHATKIVLEFIESCDGTTAWLITPDGDRLSCDWGYVEED